MVQVTVTSYYHEYYDINLPEDFLYLTEEEQKETLKKLIEEQDELNETETQIGDPISVSID